jgi:hypothetical protein
VRESFAYIIAGLFGLLIALAALSFGYSTLGPALSAKHVSMRVASSIQGMASPLPLVWDVRLDELNVTRTAAADCSAGCWRLVEARYEDPDEAAGLHHVWGRALNEDGQQLAGQSWAVAWPGGSAALQTKAPGEWADFPMYASYDPFKGETGPYRAFAGADEARSDVVAGMGLPLKHHVNFRLVWQWQSQAQPTPIATPLPTATPRPLATPSPGTTLPPNYCLFLPTVSD